MPTVAVAPAGIGRYETGRNTTAAATIPEAAITPKISQARVASDRRARARS